MGKGDSRTRRGKIFSGSYGKTRAHTPKAGAAAVPPPKAVKTPKGK